MNQDETNTGSFDVQKASLHESQFASNAKSGIDAIDFCCCLTLTQPSFYLFLNVLDLVYATFVTMLIGYFATQEVSTTVLDYLKVSLGTLNVLLFGLAIVAFIVYLTTFLYTSAVHKIYSIVRIVVCGIRYPSLPP